VGGRQSYQGMLVPALRRVDGVCVTVDETGARAEVYGVGHRLPVRLAISLRLATRLVEAGAPLTLRDLPIRRPTPTAAFAS
jgi:hypothetical protein